MVCEGRIHPAERTAAPVPATGATVITSLNEAGTGDIFSAVLTGKLLDGASLPEAVKAAMGAVEVLILANAGNEDKFKGIPIEECLTLLEKPSK